MKIKATKTEIKHIQKGELFSDKGPAHWDLIENGKLPFEAVNIMIDPGDLDTPDETVFKVEITWPEREALLPAMDPTMPPGWRKR